MLRLLSDENFNNDIHTGLKRRRPDLEIVRVQDVGLSEKDDPAILVWAAQNGFIVLTSDVSTMPDFAYERISEGLHMPGVFVVNDAIPIGQAIDELLVLVEYRTDEPWEPPVVYL